MLIEPTPGNRALAAAVNSKIKADARIINAKSAIWLLGGIGVMCALIGVGIGAAFFGYSYAHDPRTSVAKMADAIAQALDKTTLKTTGEVALKDATVKLDATGTTVKLDATGTTLKLDASGTTVKLDPNATVEISNGLKVEYARPTVEQLRPGAQPHTQAKVVTNFTVFKSVDFEQGYVVTGWSFANSEQTAPDHQYCYFEQSVGALSHRSIRITLAYDGVMLPQLKGSEEFDPNRAAMNCVWFGGGTTRPAAFALPHRDG
jgi:hypothetical protein